MIPSLETLEISDMSVIFDASPSHKRHHAQHEDDVSDDETASTITAESATTSSSHRSIFGDYWQKNGGEASRVTFVPVSALHIPPLEHDHPHHPTEQEDNRKKNRPSSPRRSIFGTTTSTSKQSSSPSDYLAQLASQYQPDPLHRKVYSDSLLVARPPSLLRQGRFSLNNKNKNNDKNHRNHPTSNTRRRSVTFDERVNVREFSKPLERYAMQGWDQHFAV